MIKTKSIFLIFLVVVACGNKRRPGLSDKELFAQRDIDSLQQLSVVSDMENYVVPTGIKYRESRAIDPANPPVVLDISNRNLSIRRFNLSDYYSNVHYVTIKHPLPTTEGNFLFGVKYIFKIESSTMSGYVNSHFNFYTDSIVAGDIFFGYHSYDNKGNFLRTVKTYDFPKDYDVSQNKISCNCSDYSKAMGGDVNNNRFRVDDETIASYVYNVYYRTDDTASNDFLFTFGLKGDTLCVFRNYNPIPDKKGLPINAPAPNMYFYNGIFTIQQSMNDTIYRMTAPNRLVPVFVTNFGAYKLDIVLAGDFSNKFFPNIWKETDKYILFTYNQNYNSPNNRRNGSVQFFYSYYDKKTRHFYHFSEGTSIPSDQFLMENPIPDALPFILSYAEIEDHQLRVFYTKKRLEEITKSKEFAFLSSEQQNKLKTMQNELDDSEVLIMILE